ncbi:MAG: hypothetical protein U0746_21670 [Gemmataceae bacterium]
MPRDSRADALRHGARSARECSWPQAAWPTTFTGSSRGRTTSIAELVRLVKCNSSGWVHDTFPAHHDFAWQNGYGAFSVSRPHLHAVKHDIATQAERHAKRSFQDEFRELLRRHDLEWDERYVWD